MTMFIIKITIIKKIININNSIENIDNINEITI